MIAALTLPLALGLLACADKSSDDTGIGSTTTKPWASADLAPLSSGECPDLSGSGTSTFLSSDEERTVTAILPTTPTAAMPLVIFFHGLMDPTQTPDPTEYMATALDMQGVADENGVVILLPEAPILEMLGYQFYLWDMLGDGQQDMTLFDDLRTCAGQQLDVDLDRLVVLGFSGGALWTTEVLSQRADTLAGAVEMSGGADVVIPLAEDPIAQYDTPAWALPVLLQSGGSNDVWPSTSFTVIDFTAATDLLAQYLVDDGSLVVRCEHSRGHTVTTKGFDLAVAWALGHTYQQVSPWADGDLGDDADWCTLMSAGSGGF
ncbi:MAG: hypothetical protein GXP62_18615 [Oligoflexia bacterium]|nr:hypothetical protein [Oligoflexia bacterium]